MSETSSNLFKWDVFLSFRGIDTRRNFISFLYKELDGRNIRTFKDDKELEDGQRISPELKHAIKVSKFAIVVVSVNYAASPWCLTELVDIMELENKKSITVIPIFYGVDPSQVRRLTGEVAEQFKKHECREDPHKVVSWKQALTNLANISGSCSSESQDDSDLVDKIADRISEKLMLVPKGSNGRNIEGIDKHMKALYRLMDLNSKRELRVVGIWARGCKARSALAKFIYQEICQQFESHYFLESVKRHGRHLSHFNEEFQSEIQGQRLSERVLNNRKVLLVIDDVNKPEQLDALAEGFNSFGPGSVVIITTQDKQLLHSYGIKHVYEVERLRFQMPILRAFFRQFAFKQRHFNCVESALLMAMDLFTDCFGFLRDCLLGNMNVLSGASLLVFRSMLFLLGFVRKNVLFSYLHLFVSHLVRKLG